MGKTLSRNKELPTFFGEVQLKGERTEIDLTIKSDGEPVLFYRHPNGKLFQGNSIKWLKSLKSVSGGWWYTSRLPNGYRVLAYHGDADTVGQMAKEPRAFLDACNAIDILPFQVRLSSTHLRNPIQTHNAGISKLQQPYGKGWLAVGDAALSFDPLSSQGIFFGLYSAVRGVEALPHLRSTPLRSSPYLRGMLEVGRSFMGCKEVHLRLSIVFFKLSNLVKSQSRNRLNFASCKLGRAFDFRNIWLLSKTKGIK